MTDKDNRLFQIIKKMIYKILHKEHVLQSEWHLGKVSSVINGKSLMVFVDGSTVAQKVPCNPDVTFVANDEVWVIFVNKDVKNKFVLCKRGV